MRSLFLEAPSGLRKGRGREKGRMRAKGGDTDRQRHRQTDRQTEKEQPPLNGAVFWSLSFPPLRPSSTDRGSFYAAITRRLLGRIEGGSQERRLWRWTAYAGE